MKKFLSVLLAVCVILSSSITAFAATAPSLDTVLEQIEGATTYLTKDVEKYTVNTATDFALIAEAGGNVDRFADSFIADVKANLEANDGKIISAYGENLATYGAVIVALNMLGEDPSDFYGYNIEKAFLALDPTVPYSIPSYYRLMTTGALLCSEESAEQFLEKLCDTYISNYYTMGKGADYYGFSCDNTAYFIEAIMAGTYVTDKYNDVLADAIKVVDSYKVDGGYCYNPEYGTQANANSTALALVAHSLYSSTVLAENEFYDLVNSIYADLCKFEGSGAGIFTYEGEDSVVSTKDALTALSYYSVDVALQEMPNEEDPSNPAPTPEKPSKKDPAANKETTTGTATTAAKKNTSKKSPATGAGAAVIAAPTAIAFAGLAVLAAKKKDSE